MFFIAFGVLASLYAIFNPIIPSVSNEIDIFEITHLVEYGLIGILAIIYARKFDWKVEVFSKTYFSLGMAFLMLVAGLVTYYYNESFLKEPHFLTLSNIFFTLYYPFVIYYVAGNCLYFKRNLGIYQKVLLFSLPVVTMFFQGFFQLEEKGFLSSEDLISFPILALNPIAIAFAIMGVFIFRNSFLGLAWLFIAIGILLEGIGDFWYNLLELFNLYSRTHPVQNFFHIGNMLIIYGLIKHRKII